MDRAGGRQKMDCVVLAGSGNAYKRVNDAPNKAFLKIKNQPILFYILRELADIEEIDRIIITGPKTKLDEYLSSPEYKDYPKQILTFEDQGDVLTNALYALENAPVEDEENRLSFVLPCDVPFIRKEEIKQFLDRCDMEQYDFCSGIVSAKALSRFYPSDGKPGIQMAYFHAKEGDFRISNMHLARIHKVHNMDYLKKTYAVRYLKKFRNIMTMVWELLKLSIRIPGANFYFLRMSLAGYLMRRGRTRFPNWLRQFNSFRHPESYISKILKTRYHIVETDYGVMALDIDNDTDFATILQRFDEWNEMIDHDILKKGSSKA
jgi:molybdopterin-guanine dinucleotide biosynthesis protein A